MLHTYLKRFVCPGQTRSNRVKTVDRFFHTIHMLSLNKVAWILVIVGALNWGLVGLGDFAGADWNIVNMLLSSMPQLESVVYVLVGASGAWLLAKKGI